MLIRGIDPGEHVGWCDLDLGNGGPARFVAVGECSPEVASTLIEPGYVYAIERAYGLRVAARPSIKQLKATVAQLLETNWLACQLVEECKRRGLRVFEVDQHAARVGVGVQFDKAGAGADDMSVDKQVAVCVANLVRGWPLGPRATNKHKRDAAVYALQGGHLLSVEWSEEAHKADAAAELARRDGLSFRPAPPGTYGPGDVGQDSFGGSDHP